LNLFLSSNPDRYEKYGLLDDYLRFAMAGTVKVDDYLSVAKALFNDRRLPGRADPNRPPPSALVPEQG